MNNLKRRWPGEVKRLSHLKGRFRLYRKRPVVVRATEVKEDRIWIRTREGTVFAYKGDFVIEGIHGEVYPCGREIFFKTYEKVRAGKGESEGKSGDGSNVRSTSRPLKPLLDETLSRNSRRGKVSKEAKKG